MYVCHRVRSCDFHVTFLGIIIDILYSNYVVQRAIIMAKDLSSGCLLSIESLIVQLTNDCQ